MKPNEFAATVKSRTKLIMNIASPSEILRQNICYKANT